MSCYHDEYPGNMNLDGQTPELTVEEIEGDDRYVVTLQLIGS
jgi:hypothetical protein